MKPRRGPSAVILTAIAVAVARFVAIDSGSHSVSDTLRPWVVEAVVIALAAAAITRFIERATCRGAARR